jgi:hypothetical protein
MQRNLAKCVVKGRTGKETIMRTVTWCGAIALGLLGSVQVLAETSPTQTSPTQEKSLDQAQQQSPPAQPQTTGATSVPDHTVPPPPNAQPQAPIADQAKPAAVGPAQADATGSIPTPMGATGQTMPSTISKENAELDKKPITALQFPLSDEQKQLIAKGVASSPKAQGANLASVHTAMFLPIGIAAQEFSGDVTQKVPDAARYKYVKLDDRVLIVDPTILTVVGEIKL